MLKICFAFNTQCLLFAFAIYQYINPAHNLSLSLSLSLSLIVLILLQDRYIIGSTIFLYLIAMWHAGSDTLVSDDELLSTLDQYAFYGFCGLYGLIQLMFLIIVLLSVGVRIL